MTWASLRRDPFLLAAFAFAAASRLAFAAVLPSSDYPFQRYLSPAREFAFGHWLSPLTADQLPGAPLFFALILQFTESFEVIAAAQHALGLATWCVVVRTAYRAGGLTAARWAGALLAAQLIMPYQERFALSEAVVHFFLAAALDAAVGLREEASLGRARWVLAGLLASAAALTHGEMLLLGPLLAAALALPRPGRSLGRVGLYVAAWALPLAGWLAHNAAAGIPGFNTLGPSLLIDTALPLVRYDLPTLPAAKRILHEETIRCDGNGGCTPRHNAVKRLAALEKRGPERGAEFISQSRAQSAVAAVAYEVIRTQPLLYATALWPDLFSSFEPLDWVSRELSANSLQKALERGGRRAQFLRLLEWGPQKLGWAPLLAVLLGPLCFFLARARLRRGPWTAGAIAAVAAQMGLATKLAVLLGPPCLYFAQPRPRGLWTAGVMAAVTICLGVAASPVGITARLQASMYLPLCVLAGLSAAFALSLSDTIS